MPKKDRSYDIKYVTHEFFSSFQNLDYYQFIRPGSRVGDPVVTDIRLMKYSHAEITFKLDYSTSPFLTFPRRAKSNGSFGIISPLFNEQPKIKKSKYIHLQELKPLLPKDCHSFYDNLSHY